MSGQQRIGLALVVAGGAALFWYLALLWSDAARRGAGRGSRGSDRGGGGTSGGGRLKGVRVDILPGERIDLDGVQSDLTATVARVQEVGAAEVHVAGAAREGWYQQVRAALHRIPGVELEIHDPAADDPVFLLRGPTIPPGGQR